MNNRTFLNMSGEISHTSLFALLTKFKDVSLLLISCKEEEKGNVTVKVESKMFHLTYHYKFITIIDMTYIQFFPL